MGALYILDRTMNCLISTELMKPMQPHHLERDCQQLLKQSTVYRDDQDANVLSVQIARQPKSNHNKTSTTATKCFGAFEARDYCQHTNNKHYIIQLNIIATISTSINIFHTPPDTAHIDGAAWNAVARSFHIDIKVWVQTYNHFKCQQC